MSVFGKHTPSPGYQPGNHWNVCMRCGFDVRASDLRKEWNGLIVCRDCWEIRHPQDFVKGVKDRIAPEGLNYPEPEPNLTGATGPAQDHDNIPTGNNFGNGDL